MEYVIRTHGNGWFNFEDLPQHGNYIQIHNMNCGTDRKAINRARKIIGDKKAKIVIKEVA
jgi:hypothetical protein|tara:strand:+ start:282 stop:461 length:180 start_codon:yes stop_codon:yes gene_type:complete